MRSYYLKLKKMAYSCVDFQMLTNHKQFIDKAYNDGFITQKEYGKMLKFIDRVVAKGLKCEEMGL